MDSVRCRTAERFPTRKLSFRFPGMSGTNTERYRTINHSNLLFEIVGWAVRAAHCYISTINGALKQLIEENDLPKVVFHSFRHSSITYKLKLNGGDIKAVQGDSGHAQASMVTEQYAHILDDDRRLNAQRFDDFFYQHHGAEPEALPRAEQSTPKASPVDTDAAAALAKLLADPSMTTLIKNLAKNL